MKNSTTTLIFSFALLSQSPAHAAEPLDAEQLIRNRGWEVHASKQLARSPVPEIVPVMYDQKGSSGPSCGLVLASATGNKPGFVELVSADDSATYPYCINIASMVPFKMNGKEYIAVEYIQRDTREEFHRHFLYLYRNPTMNYVVDESLNSVVPEDSTASSAVSSSSSKALEGIRLARTEHLTKTFPKWRLLERHFISERASSFAVLDDQKAQQCYFVAENGAAPVTSNQADFSSGQKCIDVLASSRLEKAGTVYYLALFKTGKGVPTVAITSINPNGQVTLEKALSYTINRSATTGNIRQVKAALLEALR